MRQCKVFIHGIYAGILKEKIYFTWNFDEPTGWAGCYNNRRSDDRSSIFNRFMMLG